MIENKDKKLRHKKLNKSNKTAEKNSKVDDDKQIKSISNSVKPKKTSEKFLNENEIELPEHLSKASVPNSKLRNKLINQYKNKHQSIIEKEDYENYLLPDNEGLIEVESELERTYKVKQSDIKNEVGVSTVKKSFDLKLDDGCNALAYTRDGRNMAVSSRDGRLATFDPTLGRLHNEIFVNEYVSDITFLHNSSMYAVAQKNTVFVYDNQGIELHKLSDHIEARQLEFLPHHYLLASTGNTGWLKYQDVSTGQLISQLRTKLGPTKALAQNKQNANLGLGHHNGIITFWTPSTPYAHVKLQAHLGSLKALSFDKTGTYLASGGMDGHVKIWDIRMWKELKSWRARNEIKDVEFSDKNLLSVGWGNHVYVYNNLINNSENDNKIPSPYLTQHYPGQSVNKLRFCPFEDILGVAHQGGLSTMIVPGAGEPNYDSLEVDPYEGKGSRREREVRSLLDKIQPDLITFNNDILGSINLDKPNYNPNNKNYMNINKPFNKLSRAERLKLNSKIDDEEKAQSDDDDDEPEGMLDEIDDDNDDQDTSKVKEKKKMRGRNKSVARHLRKKRKNVIEPTQLAMKAKMAKLKDERESQIAMKKGTFKQSEPSALDRFTRSK